MEISTFNLDWNENYSILTSKSYMDTISLNNGWLGMFENGNLQCFISYSKRKILFFNEFNILSDIEVVNSKMLPDQIENFFNLLIPFIKKNMNVDFCAHQFPIAVNSYKPNNCIYSKFGTYEIDLTKSVDELLMSMHGKHRNVIKNAEKKGVLVKLENINENINTVYEIMKETMGRSNLLFMDKNKFEDFINKMNGNIALFLAYIENTPVACGIFPYSKKRAYYLYGGSTNKMTINGCMNYLHWIAMQYFKDNGVNYYDFVGARVSVTKGEKLEGIQRFKKRFGSTFRQGYLWKYQFNPLKYKIYKFLQFIKLRRIYYDIVDQEIRKGNV